MISFVYYSNKGMREIVQFKKELKKIDKRRTLSLVGFLFILAFFPVLFSSSNKQQDTRSHAAPLTTPATKSDTNVQANQTAATTSLSFYPPSSFSNPIQGAVGQPLSIDLVMSPGNNSVTKLQVHIVFPKATYSIQSARFVVNQSVFPTQDVPPKVTEGRNGDIIFTVSTAKPIGYEATVGTLTLTPLKEVNASNQNDGVIGFLPTTSAVATGVPGNAITQENQAYIFISPKGTAVPTNVLTNPGGSGSGGGTTPGGSTQNGGGGSKQGGGNSGPHNPINDLDTQGAYSPQPSIWLFLIPIAVTFFTILLY